MVALFSGGLKKLLSVMAFNSDVVVSMCSVARLEWYLTDTACLFLGYTTVSQNNLFIRSIFLKPSIPYVS